MQATCSIALASIVVAATTAASAALYHVTDLGTLGGSFGGSSRAVGINDAGQVVGNSYTGSQPAGNGQHGFIWSNGTMTDIGTLLGQTNRDDSNAAAINSSGQVTGYSTNANGVTDAFLYSSGVMNDLGAFTPNNGVTNVGSFGYGLNDSGQVVGWAYNSQGNHEAFVYRNGAMIDLGAFGGSQSTAHGINNGSQIAVEVSGSPSYTAIIDDNGSVTPIGALPGTQGEIPFAINASGEVVGESEVSGFPSPAFLYSNAALTNLGFLTAGNTAEAFAINNVGQIVGQANTSGDVNEHAFLYTGGSMLDLNSLLDRSGDGWTLLDAQGINDNGWIVGYGVNPLGQQDAFLLTPVPEPPGGVLLAIGVGAITMSTQAKIRRSSFVRKGVASPTR